jgi:hypothetical protein
MAEEMKEVSERPHLQEIVMQGINRAAHRGKHVADFTNLSEEYPKYSEEIVAVKERLVKEGFRIVTDSPKTNNSTGQLLISW